MGFQGSYESLVTYELLCPISICSQTATCFCDIYPLCSKLCAWTLTLFMTSPVKSGQWAHRIEYCLIASTFSNILCSVHNHNSSTPVCSLIMIPLLLFNALMACYPSFVGFFSLGCLYFCLCKLCSIHESKDSSMNGPTGQKDILS